MTLATQQQADRFTDHMVGYFEGVLVPQRAMGALTHAVLALDVTELVHIRTLAMGPFVYLSDNLTPDEQIESITHSCQHVHQFWDDAIGFAWLGLTSEEARAKHEVEAIAATIELAFARSGQLPTLEELASRLQHGLVLGHGDLQFAQSVLESRGTSIAAGVGPSTESGQEAIRWLRSEMPELLADEP